MALVSATLEAALGNLMRGTPPVTSAVDAGQRWAAAYAVYAAGATSVSGDTAPSLAANEAALAALLGAAFANPSSPPTQTAQAIATAMTAFWLTPPVVLVGAPVSAIVTAVAGTAALQAGLLAIWAALVAAPDPNDPAGQAAAQHASVLDLFTKTVIVTHVFPAPAPPVVAPIV
jgi:hypothetical protein